MEFYLYTVLAQCSTVRMDPLAQVADDWPPARDPPSAPPNCHNKTSLLCQSNFQNFFHVPFSIMLLSPVFKVSIAFVFYQL